MNQMRIKRLKDRYQDYKTWYPSFIIGVDKTKQRIYDIQTNESDSSIDEEMNVDSEFEGLLNFS